MILLSTKHPQNSVYFLGSIVLEYMMKNRNNYLRLYDYFELINEEYSLTMNRFLLVLDWLFMLGKISIDAENRLKLLEKNELKLCI